MKTSKLIHLIAFISVLVLALLIAKPAFSLGASQDAQHVVGYQTTTEDPQPVLPDLGLAAVQLIAIMAFVKQRFLSQGVKLNEYVVLSIALVIGGFLYFQDQITLLAPWVEAVVNYLKWFFSTVGAWDVYATGVAKVKGAPAKQK